MMKQWQFLFEMLWFEPFKTNDDTPHKYTTLLLLTAAERMMRRFERKQI